MKISAFKLAKNQFYITTPIFYVNSVPHIGHLYSALLADACARWKHLKNEHLNIVFATGTDEHGNKIDKKAQLEKKDTKEYCDEISSKFKSLFDMCNIKYSDFIRTTDQRHKDAVVHFWNVLDEKGFIYKSEYSGWYSLNDECFLKENELEEKLNPSGTKQLVSKESGHPVEHCSETNYMFRLSEFKQKIRDYLGKNVVVPKQYNEILVPQIDSLTDLSISRDSKRINWGIPVPNDPSQIIYVWLDALVNYLTVAGYPNDMAKFKKLWPADVHVVGKDILRFHAIYWPSFLIAAELDLPKRILCHGHWLVNNRKMSKSIGNVIDPVSCLEKYTRDGLRYFLLREGVPGSDCSININMFSKYINSELANTLGNLYQRLLPFNSDLVYPSYGDIESSLTHEDNEFLARLDSLRNDCDEHYEAFNFYNGIQEIMIVLRSANSLVQVHKPWELIKSKEGKENERLRKLLFLVFETLRVTCILLQPIVPDISQNVLNKLNISEFERLFEHATVEFSNKEPTKKLSSDTSIIFKRL